MDNKEVDINLGWDLGSSFLTSKNAVQGQTAIICSEVRKVDSKFNKDKAGDPIKDLMIDLQFESGEIKTVRLNKASQKNFKNAGIGVDNCNGVKVMINVMSVLVRGEMAKSIVLEPIK